MTYPWWSLLPFIAMLGCIAVLPIIPKTSHWWEKESSQLSVALALGVPTTVWMFMRAGTGPLIATGVEYVQFIALLFALFVVSGGIHLAGDIKATPRNNTIFLAIGGLLASFIGTTGAAMLLIRPLLETNKERKHRVHTVLFTIFIVANCGGILTPLGDPPLFLGYLHGVPFAWTFALWKEWLFVLNEMKKSRNHLSVVLDEYGGTVGIVTIEDLIEEVFGDIEDEYDDYNKEIEVVKEDEYIVDGSAKLDDISELIGVNMESEEFDSVGGLIIGELGRFPDNKEEVTLNKIRFVVEEVDKNRIKKVRIYT